MARVIHFEVPVGDPDRARAFYESVFGWAVAPGEGGYWLATTGADEEPGIHGALIERSDLHTAPVLVIGVDSIEDTVDNARQAGAEVLVASHTIPSVGHSAYLRDPEGNVIGLFQSDEAAHRD